MRALCAVLTTYHCLAEFCLAWKASQDVLLCALAAQLRVLTRLTTALLAPLNSLPCAGRRPLMWPSQTRSAWWGRQPRIRYACIWLVAELPLSGNLGGWCLPMGKGHGLRLEGTAPAAVLSSFNCISVRLSGSFQKAGRLTSTALHCGRCYLLEAATNATDN